jgi:hypothetical protein
MPADRALAPSLAEVAALVALVTLYLVAAVFVGERSYLEVNVIGSLLLSLILASGVWRMLHHDSKHLWAPLLWFRVSTLVYFGIGTYLVFVMDSSGRQYLEGFFWFFDDDVFKLNLVVAVSAILVLTTARAVILGIPSRGRSCPSQTSSHSDEHDLRLVALVFLAIGLTVDYTIKAPYDLGWSTFEVPGSFMNLTRLKLVGIFLITVWTLQRAKWLLPLVTALVIVDLFFQFLLLSKGGVLISLILFLLAFLWHKTSVKRLVVCGTLVAGVFAGLQPVVTGARRELEIRYGDYPQAGFTERADIVYSHFLADGFRSPSTDGSGTLTRLTYVNAATLVINQYDIGQPADWPNLLPAVFIPRFFWPDKPIITDVARDIYELGTGRRTSQAGAGLFADAYWALGWRGVFLFMPLYGVILGVLTQLAMTVVKKGQWAFMPAVLMGIQLGLRTDGHYLADVAGGTVMLAGTFGALYATVFLVTSMKQSTLIRVAAPAPSYRGAK